MDRAREQVLAAAALAEQQHGGLGPGHLARQFEGAQRAGSFAHHRQRVAPQRLDRRGEMDVLGAQRPLLSLLVQGARDHLDEIAFLLDVVAGPELERIARRFNGRVRRHDDHGRRGPARAHLAEQGHAVGGGHAQVGDQGVVGTGLETAQRGGATGDELRLETGVAQLGRGQLGVLALVVDDQDLHARAAAISCRPG